MTVVCVAMEPPFDSDVIVVGGGPAGATAAHRIAQAGLKVILVDQQTFPRDKVCGDFVGPVALVELGALGIVNLPEYRSTNVVRRAALCLDGKELISRLIPDVEGLPSYGRVIPRMILDKWILDLAREAGVHILEGFRVRGFETRNGGIDLVVDGPAGNRNLRTRLLIGGDGSNSTTARFLRGKPPPTCDRIIGVRAYFEGVDGPPDQADLCFTTESFPGYCWLFPTDKSSANIGVGMALDTVPRYSSNPRELLCRLIERDAALMRRLRKARMVGRIAGWPLTTYNPRLPIVGNRIMLIGDAAGLINPLNGEGLQYALLSARWASDVAISCVSRDDLSQEALSPYSNRVEMELRYSMAVSSLILQLIRNRDLNPIWLYGLQIIAARARIDPAYAHITGGILGGMIPASNVVSFRIIGGTAKQAALLTVSGAIIDMLRGPKHLAKVGSGIARAGLEIAWDAMRNPASFCEWGFRTVASVAELAIQVSRTAIRSPKKQRPAPILVPLPKP